MIDSFIENIDHLHDTIMVNTNLPKKTKKEIWLTIRRMKTNIQEYVKENSIAEIDGVNIQDMTFWDYLHKAQEGYTTFINEYDKIWRWKDGWLNVWTGYSGEGKSSWLYFLILIKLLKDPNAKVAVFSPENHPRNRFIKDWVKTILGYNPKHSTKLKCQKIIDQFNDRLFYVFPSNHDIDTIMEQFKTLIKINKVNITVIDPYLQISKPTTVSDLTYLSTFLKKQAIFAKTYNISHHVVNHQVTPTKVEGTGDYIEPDMYKQKGGGNWADASDVVSSVWRPYKKSDENNSEVIIKTQKSKDYDIFGLGELKLRFKKSKNRYFINEIDIFEDAISNKHKSELFTK